MNIVSQPMRDGAKGQSCVRCTRNDGTIVGAHYQGIRSHLLGKGRSLKPHDIAMADLCDKCHDFFDSYGRRKHALTFEEKIDMSEEFLFCIMKTLLRRVEQGIITIKGYRP